MIQRFYSHDQTPLFQKDNGPFVLFAAAEADKAEAVAEAVALAAEEIDQKTIDRIDRVAVGLAAMAIRHRDCDRRIHRDVGIKTPPPGSSHFGFLCPLIGLPEPIPAWAKRALEGHHGTPKELVAALRELAVNNRPIESRVQGKANGLAR